MLPSHFLQGIPDLCKQTLRLCSKGIPEVRPITVNICSLYTQHFQVSSWPPPPPVFLLRTSAFRLSFTRSSLLPSAWLRGGILSGESSWLHYPNSLHTAIRAPPGPLCHLPPYLNLRQRTSECVNSLGGWEGEIVTHRRGLQSLDHKVTSLTLFLPPSMISVKEELSSLTRYMTRDPPSLSSSFSSPLKRLYLRKLPLDTFCKLFVPIACFLFHVPTGGRYGCCTSVALPFFIRPLKGDINRHHYCRFPPLA